MNKKRLAILLIISIILSAIPVYGMERGADTDAAIEIENADIASGDSPSTESNSSEYWSDEKMAERQRMMTSITNAVVSSMDENWSELDKALYLEDWLYGWAAYDHDSLDIGSIDFGAGHDASDAIVDRKAACDGFAKAYDILMNKAGLFCIVVTNEHMNHSWNLVRIDGKYYYVNPTGADRNTLAKNSSHNPFLFNHKFLKDLWEKNGLLKDLPNYYEERGKYYYGIGTTKLIHDSGFYYPSLIATKHEAVTPEPCDIHNKLKIYGDGTEEFLYKNLKVASGNEANNHKIHTGYDYELLPDGTCIQYSKVNYNGANHTNAYGKKSKKNCPDMEVHIYNNDGSEIDPSAYKITYKNCVNAVCKSEKKRPYLTIKWLQKMNVDPILTDPKYRFMVTINPADISTLDLKYKSATVKNGQPKIKGLSFINECGKKIGIKILKNWNEGSPKDSSKSGCTATISDNTIILEGHGNYTGTTTIPIG